MLATALGITVAVTIILALGALLTGVTRVLKGSRDG